MKVLIAEDDTVSRLILENTVRKLGHECVVAMDGKEAWELFESNGADIVISDWMMPGLDGIELCGKVRRHSALSYTYFILLTALGDKQHFLAGMLAGADDYVTKPLDRDELQVRLMAASRVTSLHRQLADKNAELERLNLALLESARTDPLTQLGNRLRLREDLEALQARVERYGHSYCAALCDLDCFKSYNDHYGHLAGDDALRAVASAIDEQSRSGDGTYRFGGEEFLIILAEQSLESAALAVERVRHAVEQLAIPHAANKPFGKVTISAGIAALRPGEARSGDLLLNEADAALYNAKRAGRNVVAIHGAPAPDPVPAAR